MEEFRATDFVGVVKVMHEYDTPLETVVKLLLYSIAFDRFKVEDKVAAIEESTSVIGNYYGHFESLNQVLITIVNDQHLAVALNNPQQNFE